MDDETLEVFGLKLEKWTRFPHNDHPMIRAVKDETKFAGINIKISFFCESSREVRFFDELPELIEEEISAKISADLRQCLSNEECMQKIDEWLVRMSRLRGFK